LHFDISWDRAIVNLNSSINTFNTRYFCELKPPQAETQPALLRDLILRSEYLEVSGTLTTTLITRGSNTFRQYIKVETNQNLITIRNYLHDLKTTLSYVLDDDVDTLRIISIDSTTTKSTN
jgi:hypothetical protein